jgi:hypothetical protein
MMPITWPFRLTSGAPAADGSADCSTDAISPLRLVRPMVTVVSRTVSVRRGRPGVPGPEGDDSG